MRPATSDANEDLLRKLPLPLAQLYRRAHNANSSLEYHQAAYYCWEAALKLLGASVVLEASTRPIPAPLRERLRSLARPSLGHWWEYCRVFLPLLAGNDQEAFGALNRLLLGPAQRDLPQTAALDASLRSLFGNEGTAAGSFRLHDFFNRLVRYRNDEVGHGPLGMRADEFYREMAGRLLSAFQELFSRLDILAGRQLLYVRKVSRAPSGEWLVECLELAGEAARKLEPFRVRPGDGASLPVPECLYLLGPRGDDIRLPPLGPLHPLLLYHEHHRRAYFLNAQQGRRHVEYLDYVEGERLTREDLAGAHRDFLQRVLGAEVDGAAVDRWAEETCREEEAIPEPVPPPPADPTPPGGVPPRLVLLYKRNAQPDEQLLRRLEAEFRKRGTEVFIDRHLAIGVDWARELERRVREADAVILLLSAASVHSDMLAYEVQIAHDEAQKPERQGKPRLLPVRVNFEDRLPAELSVALDRLQYFLWKGPQDDDRLLSELSAALGSPSVGLRQVSPPSGALPLDTPFYVTRPTDQEFLDAISRHDSFVLVRGARQMGKTSLLNRGMQRAREAGCRIVHTDFQAFDAADLVSVEAFYRCLGQRIADELELPSSIADGWDLRRGPNANFERYLIREVLEADEKPLVWGLDEVDRLFTCPFGSEVFGLFRSWHNARDRKPIWQRLTVAIAYATEAHLFITDLNQSPFNIGTRLSLEDFTPDQVAWVNDRYGKPLRTPDDLKLFHQLVGGHPYLVNRGLYHLVRHGRPPASLADEALREDGVFGDHLRRLLVTLARDGAMCDAVRAILRGKPCPAVDLFFRLRSGGVVAGDSIREARMRCDLYARYLERHLL